MSARSRDLRQTSKRDQSALLPVLKPPTSSRPFRANNPRFISKWTHIMAALVLIPYGTPSGLKGEVITAETTIMSICAAPAAVISGFSG
jgi:hypothetical protein